MITNVDTLALDLIFVVKGRPGYHHAADCDRLQ